MSGWFPRLSPSGKHIAAGNGVLTLDGVDAGPGYGPKWQDEQTLVMGLGDTFVRYHIQGWQEELYPSPGFVYFDVAPDGRWVGEVSGTPTKVIWSDGGVWTGWSTPAISNTRWAVLDHDSGMLWAGIGQGQDGELIDAGPCLEPRLLGDLLVYRKGNRIFGQTAHRQPVQELSIPREQHFWPVPVLIDGDPWVLTNTNTGRLLLYPWGSVHGYVVTEGITDFADAKQIDGEVIRVVWSAAGIGKEQRVSGQLVDLTPATPPSDVPWTTGSGEIDVLPRLQASCSAAKGNILWFRKGDGVEPWGAWMDYDETFIGLLADSSTGQMWNGRINVNWFDGDHVWLPRIAQTGWKLEYDTHFAWTDGHATLEHVRLAVDVGHARFQGLDVDLRHTYDPRHTDPTNPKRRAGFLEYSYYNATGQVRWEEWQDDHDGIPHLQRFAQPYPNVPGAYRDPARPTPFPPIFLEPTPVPKPLPVYYSDKPLFKNPTGVLPGTLNTVDGGVTISLPSGEVLSVQPDETYQTRPAGTAGPWEVAKRFGDKLIYDGTGKGIVILLIGA